MCNIQISTYYLSSNKNFTYIEVNLGAINLPTHRNSATCVHLKNNFSIVQNNSRSFWVQFVFATHEGLCISVFKQLIAQWWLKMKKWNLSYFNSATPCEYLEYFCFCFCFLEFLIELKIFSTAEIFENWYN